MESEEVKKSKILRLGAYSGAILAILGLATYFGKPISDSVLETHRLHQRLDSLAVNVNLSVFEEQFGRPQIVNQHKRWKQSVFVEDRVFVQTITNEADKVKFYSVTARDERFRHRFELPGLDRSRSFELGRDSLTTIKGQPSGVAWFTGAHNFGYAETHWVGVGIYRNYVFGLSEAGAYDSEKIGPLFELTEAIGWRVNTGMFAGEKFYPTPRLDRVYENKKFRRLRRQVPINTFGVDSGDFDWKSVRAKDGNLFGAPMFGPPLQDVVLLP